MHIYSSGNKVCYLFDKGYVAPASILSTPSICDFLLAQNYYKKLLQGASRLRPTGDCVLTLHTLPLRCSITYLSLLHIYNGLSI